MAAASGPADKQQQQDQPPQQQQPADLDSLLKEVRNLKLRVEEERKKITDVTRQYKYMYIKLLHIKDYISI
jgi:hypothetical protein